MIIWKGFGILVLVIAIALAAIVGSIFKAMGINEQAGTAVGAMIAGVAIWYVGNKFNAPEKGRVFIDRESGQEFLVKPDHSLFFIKMQYWAFIVGAIGCFMLIGSINK